jgi:hypothetical protein
MRLCGRGEKGAASFWLLAQALGYLISKEFESNELNLDKVWPEASS